MKEIERKFLVTDDSYKSQAKTSSHIMQWYLSHDKERTVRLRIRDSKAYITIKGITEGITRDEFEYEIPLTDAMQMRNMADGIVIEKTRWEVEHKGKIWEIDEFAGIHSGLVIAEIELSDPFENFEFPEFVGKEVSDDPGYFNSSLASASLSSTNLTS